MDKSALYKVADNQVVCLPKGFSFEAVLDLDIHIACDSVTIQPVTQSWMSPVDVRRSEAGLIDNQEMIVQ